MVARTAERMGVAALGLGSDLCQDQPDAIVQWMRRGSWTKEPADPAVVFPAQPSWFRSNLDFGNIAEGLLKVGFSETEVDGIMGLNWLRFFDASFGAAGARP
jgi:microsomal dipeptidase-like Zn-dependent dipeptidase